MPTDSSTQTVEVKAPVADVLAVIRDVESQATWIPEVREVELLEGRLQTGQEGRLMLEELAPDRTSVTYELTIHHNLPLPGILRRHVINGLVAGTLHGLKDRLEL